MLRRLRLISLVLPVVLVLLVTGVSSGVTLPPQASDEAHAHVTHGPDGLALDRRGGASPGLYSVDDHADWLACQHDGQVLFEDYVSAHPGQNESLPQVHAIYVHPAKVASRFPQFAAMFQADARQSSALLQTLGRDVRWDVRPDLGPAMACSLPRPASDGAAFRQTA